MRRLLPPVLLRVLLLPVLLLTACGPIPVGQAERACLQSARLAEQPRGEVGIGIDSDGDTRGILDVTVSSNWILNRDPSDVYARCVLQRSGQMPSRPYYSLPQ